MYCMRTSLIVIASSGSVYLNITCLSAYLKLKADYIEAQVPNVAEALLNSPTLFTVYRVKLAIYTLQF